MEAGWLQVTKFSSRDVDAGCGAAGARRAHGRGVLPHLSLATAQTQFYAGLTEAEVQNFMGMGLGLSERKEGWLSCCFCRSNKRTPKMFQGSDEVERHFEDHRWREAVVEASAGTKAGGARKAAMEERTAAEGENLRAPENMVRVRASRARSFCGSMATTHQGLKRALEREAGAYACRSAPLGAPGAQLLAQPFLPKVAGGQEVASFRVERARWSARRLRRRRPV